jgi:hypothetical protein
MEENVIKRMQGVIRAQKSSRFAQNAAYIVDVAERHNESPVFQA